MTAEPCVLTPRSGTSPRSLCPRRKPGDTERASLLRGDRGQARTARARRAAGPRGHAARCASSPEDYPRQAQARKPRRRNYLFFFWGGLDVAPLCLEFRKTISASHAADKQGRTQAHGRPQDSHSRERKGGGEGGGAGGGAADTRPSQPRWRLGAGPRTRGAALLAPGSSSEGPFPVVPWSTRGELLALGNAGFCGHFPSDPQGELGAALASRDRPLGRSSTDAPGALSARLRSRLRGGRGQTHAAAAGGGAACARHTRASCKGGQGKRGP